MKTMLYKELRLALHPMAVAFLPLSAMVLIPNYPLYVVFFYTTLGIFFICLTGRENHDIPYTMSLPVAKRDPVRARILLASLLELAQLLIAVPFAILRQNLPIGANVVGMDANIAFFGSSLILCGVFNYVFFTSYYRAPHKVGWAFLRGSIAEGVYMIAAETLVHAVPFARDVLDTPDTVGILPKLILLLIGAAVFLLLTMLAERRAADSFEKLDL